MFANQFYEWQVGIGAKAFHRLLRSAVLRYQDALDSIGGCRIAFSALSSKLMSLGALLAAYELKQDGAKIGVAHVDSHGYEMNDVGSESELFGLWIAGESYEERIET